MQEHAPIINSEPPVERGGRRKHYVFGWASGSALVSMHFNGSTLREQRMHVAVEHVQTNQAGNYR